MKSEVYGQPISLLNVRPGNDAIIIEIAKLRNLCVVDTLIETAVPGMVHIADTRIPAFLSGEQILCWDLPVQQRLLAQAFGTGVEIQMLDMAPEIGKTIPQTAGKSLLRLGELSKINKYRDGQYTGQGTGELDVLVNLFTSFIQKKENLFDVEDEADLQLAALGTIADIMPLHDENRLIVRKGIESMLQKPRPGLGELLFRQDLAGRPLSAEDISWQLTPVINATGRMGQAEKALSLFLSEAAEEREALAAEITEMNSQRKALVEELFRRAEPEAYKSLSAYSGNMAVFAGDNILPGLTGLVASRLTDRFKVPSLTASFSNGEVKGSLRSAREYDLNFLMEQCADLFLRHGGHDFAAGFSMEKTNWNALLDRLKTIAANMELPEIGEETLEIDAEIPLSYLSRLEDDPKIRDRKDLYLFQLADRFEPYGEKNRPLLFLSRGLTITDVALMGKDELKHVKLTLDAGTFKWPAVYWNAASRLKVDFDRGAAVDLVSTVNRNWFNGSLTPQLIVKDIKRQT
jgi:single-stranded-DNA-specific exonuclease